MKNHQIAAIVAFTYCLLSTVLSFSYFLFEAKEISVWSLAWDFSAFWIGVIVYSFMWKGARWPKWLFTGLMVLSSASILIFYSPHLTQLAANYSTPREGIWGIIFNVLAWLSWVSGFCVVYLLHTEDFLWNKSRKHVLVGLCLLPLMLSILHFLQLRNVESFFKTRANELKAFGLLVEVDRFESDWIKGTIIGSIAFDGSKTKFPFRLTFDQFSPYTYFYDWPTYEYKGKIAISGKERDIILTLGRQSIQKLITELEDVSIESSVGRIYVSHLKVNFTSVMMLHSGKVELKGLVVNHAEKKNLKVSEGVISFMLNSNERFDPKMLAVNLSQVFYSNHLYNFKTDLLWKDNEISVGQTVFEVNNSKPLIIWGSLNDSIFQGHINLSAPFFREVLAISKVQGDGEVLFDQLHRRLKGVSGKEMLVGRVKYDGELMIDKTKLKLCRPLKINEFIESFKSGSGLEYALSVVSGCE